MSDEPRELLLRKLPEIEQIIAVICRRSGMNEDATEEFAAQVKLRLVDADYAVIRAFQKRSTFEMFMVAVVKRMLLDHRNQEWGKWRASAEAERAGPVAVELERLVYRDGLALSDATALLVSRRTDVSASEIEGLFTRIPVRVRRRNVSLDEADAVASKVREADPIRNETARRVSEAVVAFIDELVEEDQLILRLRFHAGMTVAQIARALHIDQPALYRRLYRHFDALRVELTRCGMSANDVEELIGTDTVILDFRLKNRGVRPSQGDESAVATRPEEIP